MEDLDEELARRDRFLRHRCRQMTPEQRMEEMRKLQGRAWMILQASPAGYARYIARNFKQRAIDCGDSNAG